MATFIETVLSSAHQRKLHELGTNAEYMRLRIRDVISKQFPQETKLNRASSRRTQQSLADLEHEPRNPQTLSDLVPREMFDVWLEFPEISNLFEKIEVDLSSKYEIFDALDTHMLGELRIEDIVNGLM